MTAKGLIMMQTLTYADSVRPARFCAAASYGVFFVPARGRHGTGMYAGAPVFTGIQGSSVPIVRSIRS